MDDGVDRTAGVDVLSWGPSHDLSESGDYT